MVVSATAQIEKGAERRITEPERPVGVPPTSCSQSVVLVWAAWAPSFLLLIFYVLCTLLLCGLIVRLSYFP